MKSITLYVLLTFMVFLVLTCQKFDELTKEPVYIQLNEKSEALIATSNNLGIDLFKRLTANAELSNSNSMISPLSISLALAMSYNGASGETKTAIQNTLGLYNLSDNEININYKQLSDALLNLDSKVDFSIANSIWYRNTFPVFQDFIIANEDFYNAEVNALDFDDPNSTNTINDWVYNSTNHKIDKIIDEISSEMVMYIINAIYFKGSWKYEFNPSDNSIRNFTLSDGTTKQVEMMSQTAKLGHLSSDNFQLVELPYGQGNWVMDLVLPVQGKNIDKLISEFSASVWDSIDNSIYNPSEVNISLPPFRFEFETNLNDVLKSMGMEVAFDANKADFSKINNSEQLYISEVKHKTYIELDEKGTEAAAVTSVGVGTNGGGYNIVFNRPFLFVIREISTGVILFVGKVENPVR